MKKLITIAFLLAFSISIAAQNPYFPEPLPMRERAKVIDRLLDERIETILPKIMRLDGKFGFDFY